jgi:hypothetical protein
MSSHRAAAVIEREGDVPRCALRMRAHRLHLGVPFADRGDGSTNRAPQPDPTPAGE